MNKLFRAHNKPSYDEREKKIIYNWLPFFKFVREIKKRVAANINFFFQFVTTLFFTEYNRAERNVSYDLYMYVNVHLYTQYTKFIYICISILEVIR